MSVRFVVTAPPPFRFSSVVRSHGWSVLLPFTWNAEAGELGRVEQLATGKIVQLTFTDATDGIGVRVNGKVDAAEKRELRQKIAWMFSLDLDLAEFYAAVAHELRLAHAQREAHGRFLRSATVWEDVVKVMMTTNIQWVGTKRLVRVLVEQFGATADESQRNTSNGKSENSEVAALRAFPTAETIARTRESRLRKLGLGYRSPYLLQLARGVVAGRYDLEGLKDRARSTDEVRKDLLALPGIGPYAAATMLMILGRYEYLGVDTEALSAVSRGFYDGKPIGEKEVQKAFASWDKWKALAYWFWDWDAQA